MTIAETAAPALPSFGILARFREIFSLVFRRRPGVFIGFSLLALLILLIVVLGIPFALFAVAGVGQGAVDGGNWLIGLLAVAGGLFWLVCHGVMTMAGCDEMAGVRRSVGTYVRHTLKRLPALVVLGFLAAVAVAAGFGLLGIVGLWASGVYSVIMPAVLWDGAGWRAMGRSRRLTKEYRWPIVGLLLLMFATFFLSLLVPLVVAQVLGDIGGVVGAIVVFLAQLASFPIFAALPVVIYSRLRDIKEGGGTAELRAVFE